MSPPWFVDERCRDLKIVSSFEALAVNATSPSVIVGSQVVPNSDAGFCQIPLQPIGRLQAKSDGYGRGSILHFCWTKGEDIKQIMFHARRGLQGAKKTAWQGVMSSRGKGLGGGGGQGIRSKVQNQSKNLDPKWPALAGGLWPHGSPIISAPHGLAINVPPR